MGFTIRAGGGRYCAGTTAGTGAAKAAAGAAAVSAAGAATAGATAAGAATAAAGATAAAAGVEAVGEVTLNPLTMPSVALAVATAWLDAVVTVRVNR